MPDLTDDFQRAVQEGRIQQEPDGRLTITTVEITHPQGYANHEFEYEDVTDLFRCWRCGGYEVSLRDHTTGEIRPCPGPTTTEEDTDA